MRGTVRLRQMHAVHREWADFNLIYIREAHPRDGWYLGDGIVGKLFRLVGLNATHTIQDPKTLPARRELARRCAAETQHGLPTYVDEMQDHVNKAYAAWPTRLYFIDQDAMVRFASGPGPFGFKPNLLERALQAYTAEKCIRT